MSAAQTKSFNGCLTAGSSPGLEFAVTGSDTLTLGGTVESEFPVDVQVLEAGFVVGVLFSQNDMMSAHFSNIHVIPDALHDVYITNLGQNNPVSVSLQFS